METKKDIRKKVFAARASFSEIELEERSQRIYEKVTALPIFNQSDYIYAYIDCKKEVSTRQIIETAWKLGKKIAVPKVDGKKLIFYDLRSYDQLEEGGYHIPEPARGDIVDWENALMIMPGVAFDKQKHRVGYGGGFYDRFLEIHTQLVTIAVAFDFQIFDRVPFEKTDILPGSIVTETTTLI